MIFHEQIIFNEFQIFDFHLTKFLIPNSDHFRVKSIVIVDIFQIFQSDKHRENEQPINKSLF